MKAIRQVIDKYKPLFESGGKYERYYYIFEGMETFLYAPNIVTPNKGAHIRDAIDLKRMMMTVIISMIPCLLWGIWNVGYQHYLALGETPTFWEQAGIGLMKVVPILIVSYAVGLGIEFIFCTIRRHPVNEGFLVSGMLIPLVLPPTIPLWQVALATAFAVIIGKEVFGGTGMNILNVALTARAFLYFAYPMQISGDVWTYLGDGTPVDGYTGATPLAVAYEASTNNLGSVVEMLSQVNTSLTADFYSFSNMFLGFIPGSIGETSALMALIGAVILIATGMGSWKTMISVFLGAWATGFAFNLSTNDAFGFMDTTVLGILTFLVFIFAFLIAIYRKGELKGLLVMLIIILGFAMLLNLLGASSAYMAMPAHYHLVIGGLAFGAVFMATDPVTAAQTESGKWLYGFLIGVLTLIIRAFNPAYPEGIMLAILLMNVFAPLIDFYVVKSNKQRRLKRATV